MNIGSPWLPHDPALPLFLSLRRLPHRGPSTGWPIRPSFWRADSAARAGLPRDPGPLAAGAGDYPPTTPSLTQGAEKEMVPELLPRPGLADAFDDEAPIARDGSLLGGAEGRKQPIPAQPPRTCRLARRRAVTALNSGFWLCTRSHCRGWLKARGSPATLVRCMFAAGLLPELCSPHVRPCERSLDV